MNNIEAISKLRTASEQEQIAAVMRWGFAIKYITRPSEAVQLAAVKKEGYAIGYIKNPSEAVQIAAVNQNPYVVTMLENPSEAVQLAAVKNDPRSLDYFIDKTTPSKKVILTAILRAMKIIIQFDENDWNLSSFVRFLEQTYEIYYKKFPDWSEWSTIKPKVMDLIGTTLTEAMVDLNNWSEAKQLAAVKLNGMLIGRINNPTEAVQLAAVQQNGVAISYIQKPSEAVQLAAINNRPDSIEDIKNPSEAAQLTAVRKYGPIIQYIKNPSEAVQLAAVQQNGWAIKYIRNPSEAIQLAAVKQHGYSVQFIKNPSKIVILTAILKIMKNMILSDTEDDLIIDDQNQTLAEVYWKYSQQFPNWTEWKVIEPKVMDLIGNIKNYIDVKR